MGKRTENQTRDRCRKINGKIGELLTAVELLKHGFMVMWPEIDVGYDIIADNGTGSLHRLQVKTAQVSPNGVWYVGFYHGRLTKKRYTAEDTDYFVVSLNYNSQPAFYVIPIAEVTAVKGVFWPAGQHPRYPHKWKTCKWEGYRDRWDLLR